MEAFLFSIVASILGCFSIDLSVGDVSRPGAAAPIVFAGWILVRNMLLIGAAVGVVGVLLVAVRTQNRCLFPHT